ncbi:hypothetical protein AF332_20495 [Sporosarcina globispora]|uniref:Uncharacterized protein n=1 Tax=Sporosarcina globispora TaxID=1459 RepID=A0A0M0GGM6_SPOGL|nr:hypothetical protein [Sporosarcina globispora]KON88933.1 hypothetical protein AF332_20495 [Sporosarcina globispora]
MSLNFDYKDNTKPDERFWREIGVSIDPILELEGPLISNRVKRLLENKTVSVLKELAVLYGLDSAESKTELVTLLLGLPEDDKREILILHDYENRRKQTINKFYKLKMSNAQEQFASSSLTKLKHLISNTSLSMIELYTLYSWDIKSTGDLYTYEKGITLDEAQKIPSSYRNILIDELFRESGQKQKFRVFSYLILDQTVTVILYKQVNDAPRADFDKAVRNKEVVPLMFSVNAKERTLEIKSTTLTDKKALIKYFNNNFPDCNPSPIQLKVFEKYNSEDVKNAFIQGSLPGEEKVEDFVVNKIVFRESPIKNSPKVTLELENEDIWPSVKYAHINKCIDLESLKDIESLSIKSSSKSRIVRSIVRDNGNVLFTMDDSRLEEAKKQLIVEKFIKKFGIPLNQEIANGKYTAGKADKIDYLLGTPQTKSLDEHGKKILSELIKNKLIIEVKKQNFYCIVCKLEKEITDETPDECPDCGNRDLKFKEITEMKSDLTVIRSLIRKSLKGLSNFSLATYEPKIIFDDTQYKFYKLESLENNEIIQILLSDQSIPYKDLNRLKTMMTPTIIVFVGQLEKNLESYNSDCIQAVTFGNLYVTDEHMFGDFYSQIIEKLKLRQKSFVHNAASIAEESLGQLKTPPSKVDKKYTDKKFEDDIYAILKDLFPNSEKWGKEMSGKPVPEGIFAISYIEKGKLKQEKRRVFSYDCKFTRSDEGYNLKKEEQRKAVDYIELLNDNDIIQNYSDNQELSGHVFISNRFKEVQFETMKQHFYEKLNDESNARPIFLTVDTLLYLYHMYRKNYEHIANSRTIFSKELIKLFTKEVIDIGAVDILFRRVLNKNVEEYPQLDTKSVTEFIEDKD